MFKYRLIHILLPMLLIVISFTDAGAQNLFQGNPADIYGVTTGFINPSLSRYLDNRLIVGMDAKYMGVVDNALGLRNYFISYVPSWKLRGIRIDLQSFTAGVYRQTTMGFSFAKKAFRKNLTLGGEIALFNRGFDRSDFDLIDNNDPVFASGTGKTNIDMTLGMLYLPFPELAVGASLEHLNMSNIAISGHYPQPLMISLGLKLKRGSFHPSIYLTNLELDSYWDLKDAWNRKQFLVNFAGEYGVTDGFSIDSRINKAGWEFGARFEIIKMMEVDYRFEYPLNDLNTFAWGSHKLSMIFDFDIIPRYSSMRLPAIPHLPVYSPLPVEYPRGSDLFAHSSVDSILIVESEIRRRFDTELSTSDFHSLHPVELGALDKSLLLYEQYYIPDTVIVRDPLAQLEGTYTAGYHGALQSITHGFDRNSRLKTTLVSEPKNLSRANSMYNLLSGHGQVFPQNVSVVVPYYTGDTDVATDSQVAALPKIEKRIDILPDSMLFEIMPVMHSVSVVSWNLIIHTSDGVIVKSWHGENIIPGTIPWDFTDEGGYLISEGRYYYYLEWKESNGILLKSLRQPLVVTRLKKRLVVDVTRKPSQERLNEADKIDLILGR
ncbi:MAG: type IX secretion system membrane protein PorP/SprF [candidate division Zixibacteria bacterium]|nr:type IX secretion system membrane protein PorP/SprF [candidate division Zixibacteria bacterium]